MAAETGLLIGLDQTDNVGVIQLAHDVHFGLVLVVPHPRVVIFKYFNGIRLFRGGMGSLVDPGQDERVEEKKGLTLQSCLRRVLG